MEINRENLLHTLSNPNELKRLRNLRRPDNNLGAPLSPVEKSLADWLGRLKLLHGVPFHYLVPDVDMLPMESIKFFYCDTIWLDYLVEGALSLGRSTSGDQAHDQAFLKDVHVFSRFGMKTQRKKALGHLSVHLNAKGHQLLSEAPIPANEKVTGFLLRSDVVSGWEGLEVAAFADEDLTKPCQLLRMDHLSKNVLFCLFEGMVKSVRIHEHPEVLHFGLDASAAPIKYAKSFRYPVDQGDHAAGTQIDKKIAVPVKMADHTRAGNRTGVLKINALANAMHTELKSAVNYQKDFTSSEFALQMVEGVEAVDFKIDSPNPLPSSIKI